MTKQLAMDVPSPRELGIPHDKWRVGQYEALLELERLEEGDVTIVQAPTGSGKTAWAAGLAAKNPVIALCETKMLQEGNYGKGYGFPYLFGKGNYPCIEVADATAAMCPHAEKPVHCPSYSFCEYHTRKNAAIAANRKALNYAYFFSARWPAQQAKSKAVIVVMDEAHLLPDLVLDRASVTVTMPDAIKWGLPKFPELSSDSQAVLLRTNVIEGSIQWLSAAIIALSRREEALGRRAKLTRDPTARRKYEQCQALLWKMRATHSALQAAPDDWFIRSGARGRELPRGRAPGFVCRPLTARHHASKLLLHGAKAILMSATIGDFDTLGSELGLSDYSTMRIDSQWGPEVRPVYALDCPDIRGGKTSPAAQYKQAQAIVDAVKTVPPIWSGVIHCTIKAQARNLAKLLGSLGMQNRIWVPPTNLGTDGQLRLWQEVKHKLGGALAVTWSWWTGVDLLDEKICIVAKTPYPYIGSEYGMQRMKFDNRFYRLRAAWKLQQGCGRTRRGREQDYDTDGERRGLVAIADSKWAKIQKYLDDDFRQSIIEGSP